MNKKDEIYELILSRLIAARYRLGERILVKDLVAETGVSRQPVMSALNRLNADGFVRIVPQVGCQVVDPDPRAIADFYLMFSELEALLARLAATRRDDAQLARLTACQDEIVALLATDDASERYAAANRRFHSILHAMARSPLIDERQRLNFNMSDFFINQSAGFGGFMGRAADDHHGMIDAVAAGDADRAHALTRRHIGDVAKAVLAQIGG